MNLSGAKLVLRTHKPENTVIQIGTEVIGGDSVAIMAGPCSVESHEQFETIVKAMGDVVQVVRGGCFKPRTSPYSFQGLGEPGLRIMSSVACRYGKKTVSEVTTADQVDLLARYVDVLQVGARNMQNYDLLRALGKLRRPVLLKRGISATIEEWLCAAEYILAGGNEQVILCERGIRTFGDHTRFTLDISSIPVVKRLSHLPVIVDPSHAAGDRALVKPLALAAIAAGADGLLIEVHHNPEDSSCDKDQALDIASFKELVAYVSHVAPTVRRRLRVTNIGSGSDVNSDGY